MLNKREVASKIEGPFTPTGYAMSFGAGFGYAIVLTAILPLTYRQAVGIQERIIGLLVAIFVPFWSACLL